MKCLYYLAPTLESTHGISDDLHEVGINDYFLHVISRDESGLKQQHIHSSNYLETLDVVRDGFIGARRLPARPARRRLIECFDPFGPSRCRRSCTTRSSRSPPCSAPGKAG